MCDAKWKVCDAYWIPPRIPVRGDIPRIPVRGDIPRIPVRGSVARRRLPGMTRTMKKDPTDEPGGLRRVR